MADPKIKYDIEAAVKGEADVETLAKSLDDLGQTLEGDLKVQATAAAEALRSLGDKQAAVVNFQNIENASKAMAVELAEASTSVRQIEQQLGQASAATQRYATAELQAKSALEATKTQLVAARTGFTELQAATVGSARSSVEYKTASDQMLGSIQQLVAESRLQKVALKDAANETKTAQLAENALSAQYAKSAASLHQVRSEIDQKNAALDAGRTALKAVGIETTNLAQAERNLGAAVAAVRQQVAGLAPAYAQVAAASSNSAARQVADQKAVSDGVSSIKTQLQQIQQIALLALGGGVIGGMLKDVTATADAYNNLAARIKLATGEGDAFRAGFEGVQRVAVATSSSLENTGTLFARILQAGKEFNLTQGNALKLTQSINQAVQLSGASAQASDAAITQLIQGLQSGVLRGEEFNSVMEQAPRLAQALANGLGVTTGELRKMAQAGELTSATVVKSLQSQSQALQAEFEKMPATVGRAITNLQTQWSLFVGQLDSSTNSTSYVAAGINKLANNLDSLARVAAIAGAALTASLAVQGVAALRAYATEAAVAAGATNLLTASINKVPKAINIVVTAVGFEVGYQIGTMLYENSELARKLGVGMVGYFEVVVNSLMLAKEAAAAVFTSDTIDAAYDRYIKRNQEVRDRINDMMRDAEQAPEKVSAAVDVAASKTAQLGSSAQAAGVQVAQAGVAGAAGMGAMGKAAGDTLSIFKGLLAEAQKPQPKKGAVFDVAIQLNEARLKGLDLDALLRKELPDALEKLSGPELAKFRQEFLSTMRVSGGAAKEIETGLRLIGEQAAKSLGVDLVAAGGKISKAFKDSDEAMRLLILSMPALKAAGVETGRVVGEALSKMLDGAKNQAEIDAVRRRVEALRKELGEPIVNGLLDQAKKKAEELGDALDKATPGINSVSEAMKLLGVTSDETLKNTAAQAKAAYDTVVSSGKASARELSEGFAKAAEAAIAANKGIAPSWVEAETAARGYRVEVDAAGKATVVSMSGAKDAVTAVGKAVIDVSAALKQMGIDVATATQEVKDLAAAGQLLAAAEQARRDAYNKDLDASKFMNRPDMNPIDQVPTFNSREEADAWFAEKQKQYQRKNPFTTNSGGALGNLGMDTIRAEYQAELDALAVREAMKNANGGKNVVGTNTQPGMGVVTKTIVINLNGVSTSINTDDAGESALSALLRQLTAARGTSSIR